MHLSPVHTQLVDVAQRPLLLLESCSLFSGKAKACYTCHNFQSHQAAATDYIWLLSRCQVPAGVKPRTASRAAGSSISQLLLKLQLKVLLEHHLGTVKEPSCRTLWSHQHISLNGL